MSKSSAILELVFASSFWGFGFIAAVWALTDMGPLSVTGWRFLAATVAGFAIAALIPGLRAQLSWRSFRLAMVPGLLLSATLVLQTYGLRTTTATKSGFITCLYVLLVPFLERAFLKQKLHRFHFAFVAIALGGVALICDFAAFSEMTRLNTGDLLTLLCAVTASFHILSFSWVVGRIKSAFVFNLFQSVWAGALPLALSLIFEPLPAWPLGVKPLMGLAALAFGSTLIAFSLQVRAQKVLSPSTASLLFLLESPFATVFAIYFLNESLNGLQWAGAGLILVAAAASSFATAETVTAP